MAFRKLTVTTNSEGQPTHTDESLSLVERGVEAVVSPFRLFSSSDGATQYVTEQQAALGSTAWAVGAFLVGEAVGHSRANKGQQSYIPILR